MLFINLSRAVQLCVGIAAHLLACSLQPVPATMGESFVSLARIGVIDVELAGRLRHAVGFRNIAVNSNETIEWDIVFALSGEPLSDFEQFAAQVMARM